MNNGDSNDNDTEVDTSMLPATIARQRRQHAEQQQDSQSASRQPRNRAASVAARLLTLAREREEEYQLVLMHYGLERLLYRVGRSPYASQFVVKGAVLFSVWAAETAQTEADTAEHDQSAGSTAAHALRVQSPHRATHDLDLLGLDTADPAQLETVFRDLCQVSLPLGEDDGLVFLPETVRAEPIREDQKHGGNRVNLHALLGSARISLQVDIGFGDIVTPKPMEVTFPALLPDQPAPHVCIYPRETVVAEKFEAMVRLGLPNSRMKDFYDLWVLANQFAFDGFQLCAALQATFGRRGTELPTKDHEPIALTSHFGDDAMKQVQWAAFLRKGRLTVAAKPNLPAVLAVLRMFLLPPVAAITDGRTFDSIWPVKGPWHPKD